MSDSTNEFLNPKSMSTPAACGGIVVIITNALVFTFYLSGVWVALGLSFLFGLLVFVANNIKWWERAIYYLVNSLLIFSFAVGVNQSIYRAKTSNHEVNSGGVEQSPRNNSEAIELSIANLNSLESKLENIEVYNNHDLSFQVVSAKESVKELSGKLTMLEGSVSKIDGSNVTITGSRLQKVTLTPFNGHRKLS